VWARTSKANGGLGGMEGCGVASDKQGNGYVCGVFGDSIFFGPYVLKGYQFGHCVAKYDPNGNVKWAKGGACTGGGVVGSNVNCLSIDAFSNCYMAGYYSANITFGSITIGTTGGFDGYLTKFDSLGNTIWVKKLGGTGYDICRGVATDPWGNIYVTGTFSSPSITIGSYTLPWAGNTNTMEIFLAKFDSSGNVLWAKSAGGTGNDISYHVITDDFGNVFITGGFYSPTLSFGSYTLTNANTTYSNIFLAKYDSAGNVLWAKSAGGANNDEGLGVATDATGNVYITGNFNSTTISFGAFTLINQGGYDGFLTKYDSSGNALWAKIMGGSGSDAGYRVATDNNNRIYVSGSLGSPTITIGTISLTNPGSGMDPMFVSSFDSSGNALWAKGLTGGGDDQNAIAVTPSGCIYTGGDYITSPFIIGNDTLIRTGGSENIFIAKLCSTGITANFTASATNICAEGNNCINFADYSSGNPTSWQWHFPGAIPDTSSQQNPTHICFSTPGSYPVTLIVTNASGSDTLTVSPMITVGSAPAPPTIIAVGDTLYCSHASGYQWYYNGNAIANATDSFYVWHQGGTYSVQITDSFGCNSLSAGVLASVNELNHDEGVTIYPNPASQSLVIRQWSLEREAIVEIFNVLGEPVFSPLLWRGVGGEAIDVSAFPKGVYIVQLYNGDKVYRTKFIKD